MPPAEALHPQIEELARRYVADELGRRDVHSECSGAPRCLAAGPTDVDEGVWEQFAIDLLDRHYSPEVDSDDRDACCDVLARAFSQEWQAKVQACK